MPTSHPNQLNEIVQTAELVQPESILDIGMGHGKYGVLLKEFIAYNHSADKDVRIDGIDGHDAYITELHKHIYNNIWIFDLLDTNKPKISHIYDLALLIDVIEHFDRPNGMKIIRWALSLSKNVLIATPWDIGDPAIQHEDPLQDHKYQWLIKDFDEFPHTAFIKNPASLIVLIGNDENIIKHVQKKMRKRHFKNIYDIARRDLRIKKC